MSVAKKKDTKAELEQARMRLLVATETFSLWAQRLDLMLRTGQFAVRVRPMDSLVELLEKQRAVVESAVQGLKDFEKFGGTG